MAASAWLGLSDHQGSAVSNIGLVAQKAEQTNRSSGCATWTPDLYWPADAKRGLTQQWPNITLNPREMLKQRGIEIPDK